MNKIQNRIQSFRQPYRWLAAYFLFLLIMMIINFGLRIFDSETMIFSIPILFVGVVVATFTTVRYFHTDHGKSLFFLISGALLALLLSFVLIIGIWSKQDPMLAGFSVILAIGSLSYGLFLQLRMRHMGK